MTRTRTLLTFLFALLFIAANSLSTRAIAQNTSKNTVTTPHVQAELMAYAPQGVDPGKTVWVGLQIKHQPQWHTYWKNSGDSGLPTLLTWSLPAGVTTGDIAWPAPKKITIGTIVNYGYDNTVLLPVPLTVSPAFKPPLGNTLQVKLQVKLHANWLVCQKECVPEEGDFALALPTQGSTALNAAAFEAAFKAQPVALQGPSQATLDGNTLQLKVAGLPAQLQGQSLDFFPETAGVLEPSAPWQQGWQGSTWHASLPLAELRTQSPTALPVVLAMAGGEQGQGFATTAAISGRWPAVLTPESAATTTASTNAAIGVGSATVSVAGGANVPPSLWVALLGALLGGMILNLMPCVFPVLAIKVMSFAKPGQQQREHRINGVAYSAGVVLSFLALGALLLSLRSAGEQLGWGFQLQSPGVVAALATLFTLLGLNLAGLFEFGQFLPSGLASMQAKNPVVNSFLSGVLAVAIASPCTAPFMGASLGLALGLPAAQALLIFAALGAGMALPYLAASLIPAVAAWLPRPGAWMNVFRQAMAFPMFATVVWLLWVLGQQSGINGAAALLALLVALSAVVWSLTLQGKARLLAASISIALLSILTWAIGQNVLKFDAAPLTQTAGSRWQAWAPGRVDQLLATRQPVFVDFTAAWCVTCQINERTTLTDAAVLADFAAKNVALLKADWTRRDPAITAALAQLGRNGVPVYVLYKSGAPPVVLSEILTVGQVREVLGQL